MIIQKLSNGLSRDLTAKHFSVNLSPFHEIFPCQHLLTYQVTNMRLITFKDGIVTFTRRQCAGKSSSTGACATGAPNGTREKGKELPWKLLTQTGSASSLQRSPTPFRF